MHILSLFVAFVFIASTVIQYHHHDEDGSICLRIHTDFCDYDNGESLDYNVDHVSQAHHHCNDEECSLKLSETDNIRVASTTHNHVDDSNIIANFFLILSKFAFTNELLTKHKWTVPIVLGRLIDACVSGLSLRAPPCHQL